MSTRNKEGASALPKSDREAQPPSLEGRHVRLRAVEPSDYAALYRIANSPTTLFRWRNRGVTRSPERFAAELWEGVLAQFILERSSTGQIVGLVSAFNANMRHRFAYLAAMIDPAQRGSGWPLEAISLFVNYIFRTFDIRKLYGAALGFNFETFQGGESRLFAVEGRLKDHEYFNGCYWDMYIIALYREKWLETQMQGSSALYQRLGEISKKELP